MLTNTLTGIFLDSVLTRILPAPPVANTNVATGVGVLVGTADWGPINTVPNGLGNLNEFVAAFGSYAEDGSDETSGYAQAWGYFTGGRKKRITGGGRDLRFIRIAAAGKAKATGAILDNAGSPGTIGTLSGYYFGKAGDSIKREITNGNGRVDVPAQPTATPSASGGSLATGNVDVYVTVVNNRGETTASVKRTVAVTGATGSISVTKPADATSFNVYACAGDGTPKLANTSAPVTASTYTLTALPDSGNAALPTSNTAVSTFNLTITPPNNGTPLYFPELTPGTAAAAINVTSNKVVTYAAGASTLIPEEGSAFLSGGDSGLDVVDADYVGEAGNSPTGLELAKTIADGNFVWTGAVSAAIKTAVDAAVTAMWAATVTGPDDTSVTVADAITEAVASNNWAVAYAFGYQQWLNPVSGEIQDVLPAGSIIGALCNGPYWVNITQLKLNGYLGPSVPLSETDANRLAGAGVIPITAGSVCRKGSNTSTDASINQIEDYRIPVFMARALDITVQPLLGEPQDLNPETNESQFFDDLREACEDVVRTQPKEAVTRAYVLAQYDEDLAEQNKARVSVVVRQTPKANQIIVDLTEGRTALRVVPQGVTIITGS